MSGGVRQFFWFLGTGGTSAVATIAARMLLSTIMPFEAAVAVSYLFGMALAYVLARYIVFRGAAMGVAAGLVRFAAVNAMSFTLVWAVSVVLADFIFPALHFLQNRELVAHVIGVASPAVPSYLAHKHFTFRQPIDGSARRGR